MNIMSEATNFAVGNACTGLHLAARCTVVPELSALVPVGTRPQLRNQRLKV